VVFDSYSTPVFAEFPCLHDTLKINETPSTTIQLNSTPNDREKEDINRLARTDPLHVITPTEKHLLWLYREYCSSWPELLPKYLTSVSWGSQASVKEARGLLSKWRKYPPGREVEYLEMLDITYSDPVVREFVVRQLNRMNDYNFDQYLLQMVQCLKYEPYHDSPLARYVRRREMGVGGAGKGRGEGGLQLST